jgi:hypothetical protein
MLNRQRKIKIDVKCYLDIGVSNKPKLSNQLIRFIQNPDLIGFFTLVHEVNSPSATIERLHLRNWEECVAALDVLCLLLTSRDVTTVHLNLTFDCYPGVEKKKFIHAKMLVGNALQTNGFSVIKN